MHQTVSPQQLFLVAIFLIPAVVGALTLFANKGRAPLLTLAVCAVLALCLLLQIAFPDLLMLLRRDAPAISAGQVWRLATALFFQDAPLPAVPFNFVMLFLVGGAAEVILTRPAWASIYLIGGFAAQLIALAWQPVGAGNSAAVASLAGGILILTPFSPMKWFSLLLRLLGAGAAIALILHRDIHGAALAIGAVLALGIHLWRPEWAVRPRAIPAVE